MKKVFTLFAACMLMLSAFAQSTKEYTENLVITINDESTEPVPATVTVVDNGNGTINFALNNFILGGEDDAMPVGNIAVNNLTVIEKDGVKTFSFNDKILIAEGNDPNYDFWMGPMLEEIPLTLEGQMNEGHLHVTIGIVMEALEQVIKVELGDAKDFEGVADAIANVSVETGATYYAANGVRLSAPCKGMNVVKYANGQVKKVLVK